VSCSLKAIDPGDHARALAEGLVLGSYRYHGEKTSKPSPELTEAKVHFAGRIHKAQRDGIRAGQVVGMAQRTARDLGNHPSNILTPAKMASRAQAIARAGKLRCKVVRGAELKRRGFGGLLGVAAGSKEPPAFIEMEYRPRSFKKTVCLVGKGLTFDTGGISIKPSAKMEDMKFDMCGAAAVLGAMQALGQLRPKGVRVYGLIPTTSNMPGSNATKPGDVLRSYGGITMEVINTDAEGRLVLADALGRAQELKPDYCVDLATLTGAVVVALGHRATGLFCQDEKLAAALHAAGEHTHERMWRMPLWDEFLDDMKSTVADVKNSGSRWGGACTAAAFLKKFAGDLKWAHLDIAGTAWDVPKNELYASGATGVGVRCLIRWIEQIAG
jgi:leucyl aminopeptidase